MTNTEKKALLAEFEKFLNIQPDDEITVHRNIVVNTDEYEVGDIIDFTLTTGEQVSAMAMRQEEDGMLFVFVDCLKDERPMNKENSNKGGYEASDLRKALAEEIYPTFPDSLKARMKPVYKEDKLRLLTSMEVFGKNPYKDNDNGTQLEPMKERKNRIAFQGKGTDEWEWYWLQNVEKDSAANFAYVDYDGDAYFGTASYGSGVRPAFKI